MRPTRSAYTRAVHTDGGSRRLGDVRACPAATVDGFWSLSLYNEKGAFTDNPVNWYVIGDRDAPGGR